MSYHFDIEPVREAFGRLIDRYASGSDTIVEETFLAYEKGVLFRVSMGEGDAAVLIERVWTRTEVLDLIRALKDAVSDG